MNVYLQCECDAKKSGSTPCQFLHLSPNSVNGVKMTEMAQSEPQVYNPHIKKVLKSYQTSAMTSLSGPGMAEWNKLSVEPDLKKGLLVSQATGISATPSPVRTGSVPAVNGNHKKVPSIAAPGAVEMNGGKYAVASSEYDPFLAPPPFPIQQMPILTAPDQSRSERSETTLEGETISCFVVGGEKRLCLPQILNSVLRDFSLQQINAVCDELQIFCSRCNHEQLEVLKVTGILPFTAPSCGLITKTDAERLCNALLHSSPPRALVEDMPPEKRREQFKVYHECFGKCKGLYTPDRYSSPNARCIECTECHGLFSPQKFVCHAHKSLENRTCHWGFDSVNWRSYILLAKDQANMEQLQTKLDDMKAQFDYVNKYKRKQVEPQEEKDPTKKVKYTEDMYYSYMYDPMLAAYWYPPTAWSRVSAFRPWSPMVSKDGKSALPPTQSSFMREALPQSLPSFLSHGPPVLLNPERVVPISETERFERHYQPNVALAPPSAQTQANQKVSYNIAKPVCHLENTKTLQQGPVTNPEIEISTDTDETLSDSTISAESTDYVPDKQKVELDSTERKKVVDVVNGSDSQSPSEADLEPLRKLLEDHGLTNNIVDDVLKEVGKIQEKYEEKLSLALQAKKLLQHEMDFLRAAKKEKLREAAETKRGLRKELDHLRSENERKMKEAQEIQQKLRLELEATRSRKGDKIHEVAARANLTAENEQLRTKLEIKEAELRRLEKELKKSKYQQAANEQAKALATTSLSAIIKREVIEKVPSTVGD